MGTRLAADNHTCEDVDECSQNNAGCSHTCLNTLGRAFCLCPSGFMLGTDWKTCYGKTNTSSQFLYIFPVYGFIIICACFWVLVKISHIKTMTYKL